MGTPGGRGESGDSPVDPPNYEHLSTQLSALLADMVRSQEVAVTEVWSPDVRPGGRIGRFQLIRELGRGGFGVVYEAVDGELSRTVALKVVRAGTRISSRGTEWLLREAEAVARLNHPNIVTLHDFGKGPTGPYLVFELLRGRSLAERLRAGAMPLDEVLDFAIAVSRALVHAHGAGVIHRDLTPANVHLGEDGVVKVLDFGLAHLFGRDGANDGGTPAYMAPEQWEGDRGDGRTDLFALGVILHQALTGKFPYKVDKGWSEALEPGETPTIPRALAPAPLRRLVRQLIDREPELRPENARIVRDALLALRNAREGAGRRRVLWAALGVAGVALGTAAWLWWQHEAPPGEQVKVVVTAMENGAGTPALEAVPGLLATALEPSPRVRIVPASRLAYVARAAGLASPERIDAASGRELARLAGAAVLLVPSGWQEDGRAVVGVRGIEAESGKVLFSTQARLDRPGELAGAVDRLSDAVRRQLNERADDRRLRRPVAELVTASPEAARLYYEGLDCVERPVAARGSVQQCAGAFQRALALDPTFSLAHYQLAAIYFLPGDSGELARPHLRAALAAASRLPAREAQLVRALQARVDGRTDEALRIYDELLASAPEDPALLSAASDLQIERGDWGSASRYLEKLATVEPDEDLPLRKLIEALGRSKRTAELQAIVARLAPEAPRRARALVEAYVWLGDHDAAVRVADGAVAKLGEAEDDTLRYALQAAGDFVRVEEVARRELDEADPRTRHPPSGTAGLEAALVAQGRVSDALRLVDRSSLELQSSELYRGAWRQAMHLAATGDAARVWPYAARAYAMEPKFAADLAVVLVLLGDVTHGDELAKGLPPGSSIADQYAALRTWRAGDAGAAMAALARAEAADPWPNLGMAPAYLLAEISAATGDDLGTLSAVERFHRLPPDRAWREWGYPRSLLLSAEAHLRLGDSAAARTEVERLLSLLSRADRGFGLVERARALRRRL